MKIFAILSLLIFSLQAGAQTTDSEKAAAQGQLSRELAILAKITPTLERIDYARVLFLKGVIDKTLKSVATNGLGHMETIRDYQELIVAFRFSQDFFRKVETIKTQPMIAELNSINASIIKARGFDDSPYTQLIASIFTQMKKLIDDLQGSNVSNELKVKLSELIAPIGTTIAVAKLGDRPKAFASATEVHRMVTALYPDLQAVTEPNEVFETILGIQGLNEFFAEYAQIGG
jgi:hypothetical protein